MKTIDGFTAPRAFAIAAALSGINPKNLLLVVGAAAAIAQTGISDAGGLVTTPRGRSRAGQIDDPQREDHAWRFFPPKTPAGEQKLFETVETLRDPEPTYVSVTYGAGGGTRALTVRRPSRS